ncbi:MAG: hypothetical protein ACHP9T_00160 [Caulobacterales bacterium]|jgi:hypothetical protein
MKITTKTLMCGIAAMALMAGGGAAYAQTTPMKSGDSMKGGAMASSHMKMSKSDMKMMKKCEAMGHDQMMADAKCRAMMDAHPDMMKK